MTEVPVAAGVVMVATRGKESARSCDLRKKGFSPLNVSDLLEVLKYQAAYFLFRGSWLLI